MRIKSVWLKRNAFTPTAFKIGGYILTGTIVRENGIWKTAEFNWSEQNQRWERFE